ncbi:MAG: hypothetical protein ACJAZ9_001140 [Neolewinella sp.]|jgi:uncharacterized protein (DUF58 family)
MQSTTSKPTSGRNLTIIIVSTLLVVASLVWVAVSINREDTWWLTTLSALPIFIGVFYLARNNEPGTPAYQIRQFLFGNGLFTALAIIIGLSICGFYWRPFYWLAIVALVALLGALVYDYYFLYTVSRKITAERLLPKVLSLSDEMQIRIKVHNASSHSVTAQVVDELPFDLQIRDHQIDLELEGESDKELRYPVRPLTRGEYEFGQINIFLRSKLRLAEWRLVLGEKATVPVYPSIIQMQKFALQGKTTVPASGRRRLRRLAKSYEFDQIKNYVQGDDLRSVNWKATSRMNTLMVNMYEDERAQRVYCVIDKGRTMLMPFEGLSLLDYAINATLALSNVIINREDRAGLLTFSDKIGTVLPADSKPDHLRRIMEALYREEERQLESNYDLLYYASRKLLGGRSLIILFTNFESNYALDRVLPGLRRIAKAHQLVVVMFENTEIADLLDDKAYEVEDIYRKATARNFLQQRELMAARLRQNGVKVVLTRPEDLTGSVINKYLELKSRGLA